MNSPEGSFWGAFPTHHLFREQFCGHPSYTQSTNEDVLKASFSHTLFPGRMFGSFPLRHLLPKSRTRNVHFSEYLSQQKVWDNSLSTHCLFGGILFWHHFPGRSGGVFFTCHFPRQKFWRKFFLTFLLPRKSLWAYLYTPPFQNKLGPSMLHIISPERKSEGKLPTHHFFSKSSGDTLPTNCFPSSKVWCILITHGFSMEMVWGYCLHTSPF